MSLLLLPFFPFSNIILKLADLCKCTRRLNGSMVFGTSHSYEMFMFLQLFSMLVSTSLFEINFGSFGDLFFGALGC